MINETQINIEEIGGLSDILDCFENARYFTDNEAIIVAIEDAIVDRGATEGLILIPVTMIVDGKKYDKKQIGEVIEYLLVEMERNTNEATKKTEIYKEIVDIFKNYINDNSNYDSDHKEEEVKTNELYFGICKENGFAEDELTMGKVYEIRAEDEHCCFVLNDLGKVWCYSPTRFSKIYGEINKENIDEQGDYYLISPDEGIRNYYNKNRFKKMNNDKFTITQNSGEEKPDMVNHPKHYTSGALGIEVINTMEMCTTKEEFIGYLRCNALKYISRFENKNGLEDVKKCAWYIKKYLDVQGLNEKDCKSKEAYNALKIVENSVTKKSLVQVLKGIIIRDITQRAISDSIVFIEKLIEELEK